MRVPSLGQEDPLEWEMATDSKILAWEIPWTEKPGGLQSLGSQKNRIQLSDQKTTTTKLLELTIEKQNTMLAVSQKRGARRKDSQSFVF